MTARGKPLLRALRGEAVRPIPYWLMRQAGRYLPEYRALRERAGSFLDLCYTPALAAEATLQPIKRFGMDGAILFSDILLVPQALGRLHGETPNISVSVLEGLDEAMTALHDGEVEIVVGPIAVFPASRELIEEPLVSDPLGVVMRARNPLARRRSLSLRDLRDVSWALPSERSAFRRQLEALFVTAGVQWPTLCLTTNSMTALKAIVTNSDAITIMPRRLVALEIRTRRLASVPLRDTGRERTLGMTWLRRRALSPIAERFLAVLRAVAREDETC